MGPETRPPTASAPTWAGNRRSAPSSGYAKAAARSDDDPLSPARIKYLINSFGRSHLAGTIGVRPSQLTRWAAGKETLCPAAAVTLIDFEHILAHARLIWGREAAQVWMTSRNSFLDGAEPTAVLRQEGCSRVLEVLQAEMWGGSA